MRSHRALALVAVVGVFAAAACSSAPAATPAPTTASASPSAAPSADHSMAPSAEPMTTDSPAADLRTTLNLKLGEHIIFASKATGAALAGNDAEYKAYADLLNANGTDLGGMIEAAFGAEAKDEFNRIWSAHNGFFVDYTVGVATNDMAKQDKAVQDLTGTYVPEFSKFIADATGLPLDAVAGLITDHVTQTKQIVDDQAKKDWPAVYKDVRTAYAHMSMIGDPVAQAIVAKMPDKFEGDAMSGGVDLRVGLNGLLQEHLYLASSATGSALGGMSDQFAAAGEALNTNGTDIGAAIGSLYGDEAKDQFNKIWSAHNGFFVDYTTGVATKDKAMQDKAVEDLTTVYVPEFSTFLAGATDLPEDTLSDLITEHVLTTKAIVDAQGAGDAMAAAKADQTAGQHMQMLGDPLAGAIVAKLPDKFE